VQRDTKEVLVELSAHMRKALYLSGSKDDPRNAELVAGLGSHSPGTKPGGGTSKLVDEKTEPIV
jgi:hypothetical protein